MEFAKGLTQAAQRAVGEQLTEEELAVFDLLTKPEIPLTERDRAKVKKTAHRAPISRLEMYTALYSRVRWRFHPVDRGTDDATGVGDARIDEPAGRVGVLIASREITSWHPGLPSARSLTRQPSLATLALPVQSSGGVILPDDLGEGWRWRSWDKEQGESAMQKPCVGSFALVPCFLGWGASGFGQEIPAPRGALRFVDKHPNTWTSIMFNLFEHPTSMVRTHAQHTDPR